MNLDSNNLLKAKLLNSQFKVFKLIIASVYFSLLVFPVKINHANSIFNGNQIKTIVIDAGHGGHDTGCLGHTHSNEKNITLSIALLVGGYIEKNLPDVKVIYTRSTDVFVELEERAAIANRNNADLFISIHCNAASSSAYGTETFVMGLHKTDGNLQVAQRENSVIELEANHEETYQNFDPNSPESYIMFSLTQNAHLSQSMLLAQNIQEQFTERVQRNDRGVKQAGFWVLWRTTMPSVLIETGFLTNPDEERFLKSDQGQDNMASAIYRAVSDYKNSVEKTSNNLGGINVDEVKTPTPEKIEPSPIVEKNTIPTTNVKETEDNNVQENSNTTSYRVQLIVSSQNPTMSANKFKKVEHLITERLNNNLYRYSSGPYSTQSAANDALKKLKAGGFSDAFITVYNGKERVDIIKSK